MPGVKILKITVALKKKKVINGRADRNVSPLVVMGTTSFWIKGINPPFKTIRLSLLCGLFSISQLSRINYHLVSQCINLGMLNEVFH